MALLKAPNGAVILFSGKALLFATTVLTPPTTTPPTTTPPTTTPTTLANTYDLVNTASAASTGFSKRGAVFAPGAMPAGSVPAVSAGVSQFYGVTRWADGSMRTARQLSRDASFSASESRHYTLTATSGSPTAATNGNAGLVSAISGHDLKATFANIKTLSAAAAYAGGALVASLATHAAVSTRWTVLTTGPVADVWQGWGMAGADAHLLVNWYVTRWKNADGSTAFLQVGAVPSLDRWSVPGKEGLSYDAALMDGSTTVVSYPGVQHPYHSQWLMALADGTAPCVGASRPTLHSVPNKDYLVATGLVPPLRTTRAPAAEATPVYVPCGAIEHRANVDGTGGYAGRGVITEMDAAAFMRGDAQAYTRARINALAGLGIPYHYRSNRQRTRPGEAADTANTSIVLKMAPKAASYYDFTALGLPIAVDAYNDGRSSQTDGFVPANGGTGVWGPSGDSSHAVSYSYFMALMSGDEWLVEASFDLAMNLAHQTVYGYSNYTQVMARGFNSATPADYWSGLLGMRTGDNPRALGWACLIMGHGVGLLPVDHVAAAYAKALLTHNADFIGTNLQYFPADFAAGSYYQGNSELGLDSLMSPWMQSIIASGAYAAFLVTEDTRLKALGDFTASWAIRNAAAGRWYALDQYRSLCRAKRAGWDASSNPTLPAEQQPFVQIDPDLAASTGVFTMPRAVYWNAVNQSPPPLTNGDRVIFTSEQQINSHGALPAGITEGTVGYIVNVAHPTMTGAYPPATPSTFQVSATPGGAPMVFSTDTQGVNLGWLPQAAAAYTVATASSDVLAFPYIPQWGNYVPIHGATIILAHRAGNPAATSALCAATNTFMAPMLNSADYVPNYDMVAA